MRIRRLAAWPVLPFLWLAVVAAPPASASEAADATVPAWLHRVELDPSDPLASVRRLSRLGFDVAGVSVKEGTADVVGGIDTLGLLRSFGYAADRTRDLAAQPEALSDYLSPAEINAKLDQYAATYPSLTQKVQYATTHEGRPVWALKISDNAAVEEDEPTILFVAQHHAREVMTPEIALDIVDFLLTGYGTDPDATRWVDGREVWVLPNHNPDGANHVFTADSNWRKNRRVNGNGTFGVDPNRNYAFRWGSCSGSSGDPGSDTYRGPSAASEPETYQGLTELARDQRPLINLSYHTYSELVIMPFGCTGSYTSENETFRDLSSSMAVRMTSDDGAHWYLPGTAPELLYAVDGEMNDWFYGELGSYGVTVEANSSSQGFQPDYATWRSSTVARNRPGWRFLLDRPDGPSVRGHVRDACTGAPLSAGVGLDEVPLSNGETPRTSEPVHGRYQFLTIPGTVHLRVTEPGYTTQVWPAEVGFDAVDREVSLVPAGSHGLAVAGVVVDDASGDADGQADPGETFMLQVRLLATGDALTGVTATLSSSDPFVTITDPAASYGSIASGAVADGDGFSVTLSADAPDDTEITLSLAYSADQALCTPAGSAPLRITKGAPSCPAVSEPLDANPGWNIQNSGTGGWQFGPPAGNGGSTGPASAPTGANVYGTNLSGPYGPSGEFVLTTTPFDLRGLRRPELRYQRWLDNEAGYDLAEIEVSVDGGFAWTPLWKGFEYGEGWQLHRLDLSSFVDQEDDVRFRFRLRSDVGTERAGFYVDDLAVCGESVPGAGGRLKYESHTVSDAGADRGNGNGTVDPSETPTLQVRLRSTLASTATGVRAFLTTSTPGVRVRDGWASFPDVPAGGFSDSAAPHFTFSVDSAACATRIAFAIQVEWDGGTARSSFTVPVGASQVTVLIDDAFESTTAWTAGGTANAGHFVREDPYRVLDPQGVEVQPDDDGTPAPGVLAWVTANPKPTGNFNPLSGDVDRGTVWVQSGPFDGAAADRLTLTAKRWFVRRNAGSFDDSEYRLRVSNDGGATWTNLESSSTDSPAWTPVAFDLTEFVASSADMRVRMEVQELITFGTGDTLIEGLLDDVRLERERLECSAFTPASHPAPFGVGDTVRVARDGAHLRLDWTAPATDASHGPATAYRVYRSASPSAGFAEVAWPTAAFAVLQDEAFAAESRYFLIVAENSGGTSSDVPLP
jgi:carboxypeptidase T